MTVEKSSLKEGDNMRNAEKENNCYERYKKLGGIINEKDYDSALARAKNPAAVKMSLIKQSEFIAQVAGIELRNEKDTPDQRTVLYGILRADAKSKEEAEYHHSDMSDQRLFAETLRMLGDADSLNKLINAYPNIAFD